MIDPDKDPIQIKKDQKSIEDALLNISGCVVDNCYEEIFGVQRVPYDINSFKGDIIRCYVNTPLCKDHYNTIPADLYLWAKDDTTE